MPGFLMTKMTNDNAGFPFILMTSIRYAAFPKAKNDVSFYAGVAKTDKK